MFILLSCPPGFKPVTFCTTVSGLNHWAIQPHVQAAFHLQHLLPSLMHRFNTAMTSVCKYSHGDTWGEAPGAVEELLSSERLKLWVRHSLPGTLNLVNGFNKVQIMFIQHLKWPVGSIITAFSLSHKEHFIQLFTGLLCKLPLHGVKT